ncbi:hypothetical protein DIPPA_19232 [Diplonema papillatum]|nr:hypothetical protein DIPPA_19232 [Diplonema papillatum]
MERGLVLLVGLAAACSGYEIKLSKPVKVGESANGESHFWRPRGGVGFGPNKAVISVQTRGERCSCGGEDSTLPACEKPCTSNTYMLTTDGGNKFTKVTSTEHFCGTKSVAAEADGAFLRLCGEEAQQEVFENGIKMPVTQWSVTAGGMLSSPELVAMKVDKEVTVWTQSIKRDEPVSVHFGNSVLELKDKRLHFRLATVKYPDETLPVVLKSQDGGLTWLYVSKLPIAVEDKNTIERSGENGLRLHVKNADHQVWRLTSKTLGRKWDNATIVTEFQNLPALVTSAFTTILSGGRAGPAMLTLGSKKGSEKPFNLVAEHNEQAPDADDYTEEFLTTAKNFENTTSCSAHPFPTDTEKCQSTGMVDAVPLGNPDGNQNLTDYLLCYDKLGGGWRGPREGESQDSVYCMKATVDETAEYKAYLEKEKKKEEKKQQERESRRRAEEYAEQQRQRKKREKREKDKKLKEKRLKWEALDIINNVQPAKRYEEEDGDLVIIRDMETDKDYADFVEESVGIPDKATNENFEEALKKAQEAREPAPAAEEKEVVDSESADGEDAKKDSDAKADSES